MTAKVESVMGDKNKVYPDMLCHKKFRHLRNEAWEYQLTAVTVCFQNIHEKGRPISEAR